MARSFASVSEKGLEARVSACYWTTMASASPKGVEIPEANIENEKRDEVKSILSNLDAEPEHFPNEPVSTFERGSVWVQVKCIGNIDTSHRLMDHHRLQVMNQDAVGNAERPLQFVLTPFFNMCFFSRTICSHEATK